MWPVNSWATQEPFDMVEVGVKGIQPSLYNHLQCFDIDINFHRFDNGAGQIWLDDLHCTATDTTLLSCRHRDVGTHSCGHHEDIAVFCNSKSSPDIFEHLNYH